MSRPRCRCGEPDCPDCGLRVPPEDYLDDGSYGDPEIEDVNELPDFPPDDVDIKGWS